MQLAGRGLNDNRFKPWSSDRYIAFQLLVSAYSSISTAAVRSILAPSLHLCTTNCISLHPTGSLASITSENSKAIDRCNLTVYRNITHALKLYHFINYR